MYFIEEACGILPFSSSFLFYKIAVYNTTCMMSMELRDTIAITSSSILSYSYLLYYTYQVPVPVESPSA